MPQLPSIALLNRRQWRRRRRRRRRCRPYRPAAAIEATSQSHTDALKYTTKAGSATDLLWAECGSEARRWRGQRRQPKEH